MSDSTPLFPASLLSSATSSSSLPESYTLRPLQESDYHAGFLDVLSVLTTVGEISEERWHERYEWMQKRNASEDEHGGEYFILVIADGQKVVGTGTLVVERKL